ncbi:MAG: BON domain-containing protein [Planctomycetales bacterium]
MNRNPVLAWLCEERNFVRAAVAWCTLCAAWATFLAFAPFAAAHRGDVSTSVSQREASDEAASRRAWADSHAATVSIASQSVPTNQEVARQLAKSLIESDALSEYRIDVSYQNQGAVLRGVIGSQADRDKAISIVKQHPSVRYARDRMVSQAGGPR